MPYCRRILCFALVSFQGLVAFLGSAGLHALPGAPRHSGCGACQHDSPKQAPAAQSQTKTCRCQHHQHSRPAPVCVDGTFPHESHEHQTPPTSEDECFVCQKAIQRAVVATPTVLEHVETEVISLTEPTPVVVFVSTSAAFYIRGPPANLLA